MFAHLTEQEKMFVHSFWGEMYLFPEPSRYTNHSATPNTRSDLEKMCDIAIKPIKRGEMITTNATREIQNELETFVEAYESPRKVAHFTWLTGGYRNATIQYTLPNRSQKTLRLKRVSGNWRILKGRVQN